MPIAPGVIVIWRRRGLGDDEEVCVFRVHEIQITDKVSACAGGSIHTPAPVAFLELLSVDHKAIDEWHSLRLHRFRVPVADLEVASILYQLAGA